MLRTGPGIARGRSSLFPAACCLQADNGEAGNGACESPSPLMGAKAPMRPLRPCARNRICPRHIRANPRSRDSSLLEHHMPCLQPRTRAHKKGRPKGRPLQNAHVPYWRSTRRCGAFALLRLLQQAVTAVIAAIQHVDQVRVAVGVSEEVVTQQVDLHQGLFLG